MTVAVAHIIAAALACAGLWLGWRGLRTAPRPMFLIATAGFLVRTLLGELLFWISWLRLPVARSLQLGDGYWFYALDGVTYFRIARRYAVQGWAAVLHLPKTWPAPLYIQSLASGIRLFGDTASISILLNAAAYLATAAVLIALARRDERLLKPAILALAAISFAPGALTWSLQPLKDTFAAMLIAAFAASLVVWQDVWAGDQAAKRAVATGAAMAVLLYAISSVRWYVAVAFLAAFPLLLATQFLGGRRRRASAAAAGMVLFLVLVEAVHVGAFEYLPPFLKNMHPGYVLKFLEETRSGFERTHGASNIAAGPLLRPREEEGSADESLPMSSRSGRVAAGVVATFIPRTIAEAAGAISIGGGHGLWLIVDADTLLFDAVLVLALAASWRLLRRRYLSPALIAVAASCCLITGAIIYTVTNFGTLFRLREMILVECCMLPLVMDRRWRETPVEEQAAVAAHSACAPISS